MPMSMPAAIAWYRNTAWIASRTGSLPRNENETLDTPPLTWTAGSSSLIRRVASMYAIAVAGVLLDARADGEDVGVEDDVRRVEAGLLGQQLEGALGDGDLALDRVRLALPRRRP